MNPAMPKFDDRPTLSPYGMARGGHFVAKVKLMKINLEQIATVRIHDYKKKVAIEQKGSILSFNADYANHAAWIPANYAYFWAKLLDTGYIQLNTNLPATEDQFRQFHYGAV